MLVIRRCVSKQAQNLNEVDTLSGAKNDGIYKHIQFKQETRDSRVGMGTGVWGMKVLQCVSLVPEVNLAIPPTTDDL